MEFPEIKKRLSKLDTACICDIDKGVRVMSPQISRLNPGYRMIGKAHTVQCHDDFLTVIKALNESTYDEILVVDGRQGTKALAGEIFTTEAQRRGLAGIVIDGACRDSETIKSMSLPVYSRYVNPMAGTTTRLFPTQVKITCGEVDVNPGDVLFGDSDGIVVATEQEIAHIIPLAEELQRSEEKALSELHNGVSLFNMLNFEEHVEKVRSSEVTKLRFI